MLIHIKHYLMKITLPCTVSGAFLYCIPRSFSFNDKKSGKRKEVTIFEGQLLNQSQNKTFFVEFPEDPKLNLGEVVEMVGFVKYDEFNERFVFVPVKEKTE